MAPSQRLSATSGVAELSRKPEREVSAPEGAHRRPRAIDRQLEHGCAGELVPPVREPLLEDVPPQPAPLPGGVIRILERELRQRRRFSAHERLVERGELLEEHPDGPPVRDDVVEGQQQHVLLGRDAQEPGAQERPARELERLQRLGAREPTDLDLIPDLGERQRNVHRGGDLLHRLAVELHEPRAERLVPLHQRLERRLERARVQLSQEPERERDVVGGRVGLGLLEAPQALLRVGERDREIARRRDERWRRTPAVRAGALDAPGELGQRGVLE